VWWEKEQDCRETLEHADRKAMTLLEAVVKMPVLVLVARVVRMLVPLACS